MGVTDVEDWLAELAFCYQELLETVDRLLRRYSKPRHRVGSSFAGGKVSEILPGLGDLQEVLPEYRALFLAMETTLRERMNQLNRRQIPLCPGAYRLKEQCREMLLQMFRVPAVWSSPSVLVGTLRTPAQLEVCLHHGFYHVPACQIPEEWLPIAYVAIYQSRSLFPDDCGIRFYGKVKSCTPVRRRQIQEIPKNSDEWYYRLEILRWEQLECPVAVREIPFTHLLTNRFLLTHSLETPELSLKTPAHYCFYQALRRGVDQEDTVLLHPGGKLRLKNGQIQLYRHGRKLTTYSTEAFLMTPYLVFHQLLSQLEQLQKSKKPKRKRRFLFRKKSPKRRE